MRVLLAFVLCLLSSCQPQYLEEENEYVPSEVPIKRQERSLPAELFSPYHPLEDDAKLTVGDVLEISVFGEPETEYDHVTIAPDGRLYYMFVDDIQAAGKSLFEVRADLEAAMRRFFIHPHVVVAPVTSQRQSYQLLGHVHKPGLYLITEPIRLREAIAKAGGIQADGSLKHAIVIRKDQKLSIDLQTLANPSDNSHNIFLRPADSIYIAEAEIKQDPAMRPEIEVENIPSEAEIAQKIFANAQKNLAQDGPMQHGEIYRLRAGDELSIAVYGDPSSKRHITVGAAGYMHYLFVNSMPALGKTIPELRSALQEQLRGYYKYPEIMITAEKLSL